jgi:hypothetical protein
MMLCWLYFHMCPALSIWFEHPELPLLFLIACICSLYLVQNARPVCPKYFSGQFMHFIWQMPVFSYLSICEWGFTVFCIVFCVQNTIFICVSLKSL